MAKQVVNQDAQKETAGTIAPAAENAPCLLVADSDGVALDSLAGFFRGEGVVVRTAMSVEELIDGLRPVAGESRGEGLDKRASTGVDVVLVDLSLGGASAEGAADLLRSVQKADRSVAMIAMTAYGSVESAVEALRVGACDYLTKPLVQGELRMALSRALRQRALLRENVQLRRRLDRTIALPSILGDDARMHRVLELVRAVAASRTTVLMSGESGTGKSLIAHAIHQHSPRKDKPFIELSCGSIPETLLESELFGHVKGAFTGAHADKVGRFLAASGGTLFLDEINSASPAMQLKLLRVLQERRFEPVGSSQTIEVDVRVILATNQSLEALVAKGLFRQDLYYRINVVKIDLPPLRERPGDIERLAHFFLEKYAGELGRQIVGFSREALEALARYAYPGNVRELQNIIERAAVLAQGQMVELRDLPEHVQGEHAAGSLVASAGGLPGVSLLGGGAPAGEQASADGPWVPMALEDALREPERQIILKALRANQGNRQKTSEQLGINRTTLYKKMKTLGLLGADDARLAG